MTEGRAAWVCGRPTTVGMPVDRHGEGSDPAPDGASARLAETLVADLRPVTPVRTAVVVAVLLALHLGAVLAGGLWLGVGMEGLARLADPPFALTCAVLMAVALSATVLAAHASIPGRSETLAPGWGLVASVALLVAAVVVLEPWGATWLGFSAHMRAGWGCTREIASIAAPLWALTVLVLARLAPLRAKWVGLLAGMAALSQGAVALQFACPVGDAYHLALTHYLPVLLLSASSVGFSAPLLRRVLHRGGSVDRV